MKFDFKKANQEILLLSIIHLKMLHINEKEWYKNYYTQEYVHTFYSGSRKIMKTVFAKYWVLIRCVDCRIYFLTAPSNRGRKDIRCPFGCREKHKRECSKKRVRKYRKTKIGRKKKQELNERRYLYKYKSSTEIKNTVSKACEEKGSFTGYLRFILSLIEGRFISWPEIKSILLAYFDKWRQHPLEYWLKLCNMTA